MSSARTTLSYEWDVETVDAGGDVLDHRHSDRCPARTLATNERLVLVRDMLYYGELIFRSWAYVRADGSLPAVFSNERGEEFPAQRVPARFHAELAARQKISEK